MQNKNVVKAIIAKLLMVLFMLFLVAEFAMGSMYIKRIPLRSIILTFAFVISLVFALLERKKTIIYLTERPFILISAMFLMFYMLSFTGYLVNGGSLFKNTYRAAKYLMQPYMIFFVTYMFMIKFGYKIMMKVIIALLVISSIIAFVQLFFIDFAWNIRYFLGIDPDLSVRTILLMKERPVGLAQYFIPLAYHIVCFFAFAVNNIVNSGKSRYYYINLIVFAVLMLGVSSSLTRSALLGIFLSMLYLILVVKEKRKTIIICMLIFITASAGVNKIYHIVRGAPGRIFRVDKSAEDKPILLSLFLTDLLSPRDIVGKDGEKIYRKMSGEKSINVGEMYDEVKEEEKNDIGELKYAETAIYPKTRRDKYIYFLKHIKNNILIGRGLGQGVGFGVGNIDISPHNSYLNTFMTYGVFGFALLLYFFYYLWKISINARTYHINMLIVAYGVHIFFHNAGPFFGSYEWWHIPAILIFINTKNNGNEKKE